MTAVWRCVTTTLWDYAVCFNILVEHEPTVNLSLNMFHSCFLFLLSMLYCKPCSIREEFRLNLRFMIKKLWLYITRFLSLSCKIHIVFQGYQILDWKIEESADVVGTCPFHPDTSIDEVSASFRRFRSSGRFSELCVFFFFFLGLLSLFFFFFSFTSPSCFRRIGTWSCNCAVFMTKGFSFI